MKTAKQFGFLAVISYGGGVSGINAYYQDAEAMRAAGFQSRSQDALTPSDSSPAERTSGGSGTGTRDYAAFVRAVYTAVQEHAEARSLDSRLLQPGRRAARRRPGPRGGERRGLPQGVSQGPALVHRGQQFHRRQSRGSRISASPSALHVANWNGHDETSVKLLHQAGSDWAFYNGGNRWTFGDYMYKAAKQFDMKFRISWHWNASAGDPYYALDCREDDYAWCNATPDGRLISAVDFEQIARRAGRLPPSCHARPPGAKRAGRIGRGEAGRSTAATARSARSTSASATTKRCSARDRLVRLPPYDRRRDRSPAIRTQGRTQGRTVSLTDPRPQNETLNSIERRHSVRVFLERDVPDEFLRRVLDAANAAPSAHNQQSWRFAILRGEKKKEMAALVSDKAADFPRPASVLLRMAARSILGAPVVIAIVNTGSLIEHGTELFEMGKDQAYDFFRTMEIQSSAAAVENLLLAATSLELGSVWLGVLFLIKNEIRAFLGEPAGEFMAVIPLGYAAKPPVGPKKQSLDQVVKYLE